MPPRKKGKILVAMSGGVDSSVVAWLLKKDGFFVEGVFLKLKDEAILEGLSSEDRARKIANFLEIPFRVLDLRKNFEKEIIGYFLKEIKNGRTPNPCVLCNKEIKIKFLLKEVEGMGFDFLATGHYAKIKKDKNGIFHLFRGKDKKKDQSYFLWKLNQSQLSKLVFPLADLEKEEIKKISKRVGIFPFCEKESMEVCFVDTSNDDFLRKNLKEKEGNILDLEGKFLGKHKGFWFYTIGQRRGLNLPGGPFFVVSKKPEKNDIFVSKNEDDLLKESLILGDVAWVSGEEPKLSFEARIQIRYRQKSFLAKVDKKRNRVFVSFKKPQKAITPGQSAVFFNKNEVLGGGIIQ